ncbi:hypothetical protein BDY24DRAFT_91397 [Mrakia frigida]|uniref:uncharacterized protein n=1 Tax=Mrakia frigida TaxID=29902 RepID=UPI003FCC1BC7
MISSGDARRVSVSHDSNERLTSTSSSSSFPLPLSSPSSSSSSHPTHPRSDMQLTTSTTEEMFNMSPSTSYSSSPQQTTKGENPRASRDQESSISSSFPLDSFSPGSSNLSSWNSEGYVRTPGNSWGVEGGAFGGGTSKEGAVEIREEEEEEREANELDIEPSVSRSLGIDRKGKGRAIAQEGEEQAQAEEPRRKDQPNCSFTDTNLPPPFLPSSPLLISPPTPITDSPSASASPPILSNDSPPPEVAVAPPVPFKVFRSPTQPFVPRPPSTSSSLPPSIISFPGITPSSGSTPSRLTSRSRANSLLSFSPSASANSSASGSSSVVGRKLDEIKEKLKSSKVGAVFKKKSSVPEELESSVARVGESSTRGEGGGRSKRLSLFGQRRSRAEGLVGLPSSNVEGTSLPITTPIIELPSPTTPVDVAPSTNLLGSRPPSPFPSARPPPPRSHHLVAPRPIVTRAVTTTSLTPPSPPTPTPFLLPRSTPASPNSKKLALPFSPTSSNNPSLLSLTRPSSPAPPRRMDHFDRMLPREIKLLVFRTLLEIWKG